MKKKIRFQQLEARVLLDAAGLATAAEGIESIDPVEPAAPEAQDAGTDELDATLVAHLKGDTDGKDSIESTPLLVESTALVVVDTTIENYETLIENLSDDTEILFLEGDKDGLDQIANYVEGRDSISSIHVLSHGESGEIRLGNSSITSDTLTDRADTFARIGEALTEDGDILLYGCDIAGGEAGIDFVSRLAMATGADVAASDDLTGSSEAGGDWELEHQTGSIETTSLSSDNWDSVLDFDPAVLDFDGFTYLGGSGTDTTDDYSVGDAYLFEDVGTDGTNSIDAVITITDFYNSSGGADPTMNNFGIDYDPGGLQSADWLPTLDNMPGATNLTYSATFKVQFYVGEAGTGTQSRTTPLNVDANLSVFDLDSETDPEAGSEQIKVTAPTVSVVIAGGDDVPAPGNDNNVVGPDPGALFDYDVTYAGGDTTIHLSSIPGAAVNDFDYDEHWAATFQVQNASEFIVESIVVLGDSGSAFSRATGLHFDSVTFTSPDTISIPILDLDADDSSGATDLDFNVGSKYKSGDGSIDIVDSDLVITDSDPVATSMQGATVSISNPESGDVLNVGTLPAGISASGDGTTSIELSGVATITEYEAALKAITYANNNAIVEGGDRQVEFTVNNGDIDSPPATSTITVFGTPTVDPLTTINDQPTITGTWDDTNGTDLTVTVNGIAYTLSSSPELTETGGVWTLDMGGVQTLPTGTYNISVVATDGSLNTSDQTTAELQVLSEPEWGITGPSGITEGSTAVFNLSLAGSEALTTGESASVVLNLTDIDTDSSDYADFDTAVASAITAGGHGAYLSYNAGSNTLTYTSPSTGTPMPTLSIDLGITTGAGGEADEDFSVSLASPDSSDLSGNNSVTTTITELDEAPTLTASPQSSSFNEGTTTPANLFDSVTVDTVDAGQTIEELVFTVTNVADGASEVVFIDGKSVSLTNGNSGSTVSNGYSYSVSVSSGTATVTVDTSGATEGEIESLIDNLGYKNNKLDNPTAGDRDITITSITDSGTSGGSNENTTTTGLPGTATVSVVAINDAPVIIEPATSFEALDTNPIDIHGQGFSVADVDIGLTEATLTLQAGDGTITVSAGNSGVAISSGNGTGTVVLTGTMDELDNLLTGGGSGTVTYQTSTFTSNDTFTVTVNDGGGTGTGGAQQDSEAITIVRTTSSVPVISDFSGTFTYDEGEGVVFIDQGVAAGVTDPDSSDFQGGRLYITPGGNITAEDRFAIDESGDFNITGAGAIEYMGTVIGNISGTYDEINGGYISLNANANPANVAALVQSLTYENIETGDPTATPRTIDLRLEDGDGGVSLDYTVTININAINEAPVVDLDANDSSGVASGGFKNTFISSAVNIVDTDSVFIDPESDPVTLKIVAANIADGADEILNFGGAGSISLNNNAVLDDVTVAGVSVDIVYTFATNTINITAADGVSGIDPADATAVMEAITYQNDSGSPTASPSRTFTVTTNDGLLSSNAAVSTIEINVAPEINLDASGDYSTTFTENGGAINIVDVANAAIVDANNDDVSLTIVAANISDVGQETLSIGSATVILNSSNQAYGDVDVNGVSVDIFYDGATQTFSIVDSDGVSPLSPADATTVLKEITYNNSSDTPTTSPDRTFTITANDGNTDSAAVATILTVADFNDPPAIQDLDGRNTTYIVDSGAVLIDQNSIASVVDPEENFDGVTSGTGGTLTVSFASGATALDTLAVKNVGTGAGQISVSGSNVLYEGTVIGSFSGGTSGTDLEFTFNANADNEAVSALINNLTFQYDGVITGDRELEFTLVDDANEASNTASVMITIGTDVVAANDFYSIDSDGTTVSGTAPGIIANDSNSVITGATLIYDADTASGANWTSETGVAGYD